MEMRTPPGNGLHPRRSLYFVPKTNVERARNSSALPALIATYDERLHKVLLRQPTDFRRQINACQYRFEVEHLQKGARILNFA